MPNAEIIAIGTELLLGEIADTNTAFLAKALNQIGIDVFRTMIVGDNQSRITEQIRQSIKNAEIVITTGGLGPTVDDPTRQAVSDVFNKKLIFHEYLWEQIQARFKSFDRIPTKNNRKQAYIPQNANPIENPVGTAPAFYVKEKNRIIICLPGVPAEMEYLFTNSIMHLLKETFKLESTIFSRTIHTAGIGESSIDDLISQFEKLENPTVGITAKPGQVDIRITAKASNKTQAKKLITPVELKILLKIGKNAYGFDQDTLLNVVSRLILEKGIKINLFHNTGLSHQISNFKKLCVFQNISKTTISDLEDIESNHSLYNNIHRQKMMVFYREYFVPMHGFKLKILYEHMNFEKEFWFGGHKSLIESWIENNLLNSIREVINFEGEK